MPIYLMKVWYLSDEEGDGVLRHYEAESPHFLEDEGPSAELLHAPASMTFERYLSELNAQCMAKRVPYAMERAELWDVEAGLIVDRRPFQKEKR